MYLEISSEALIAITENKMIVKQAMKISNDEVVTKLCEMYINLADGILDNVKEDKCKKTE